MSQKERGTERERRERERGGEESWRGKKHVCGRELERKEEGNLTGRMGPEQRVCLCVRICYC